jgi:ribokinase
MNVDYVYQVDHFVGPGETIASTNLQVFPGGKGLNQSIALARAGVRPIHGAVSGLNGDFLIRTMQMEGVDINKIRCVDAPSGHAIIQVDKAGQNCIILFSGTNGMLDLQYIESFMSEAEPGDILVLQNEINCLRDIMLMAKEKEMRIAFNPSPYDSSILSLPLEYVTWWFCNEIEAAAIFGGSKEQIIANFRKTYPCSNLILTLGEAGSVFVNEYMLIEQKAYMVDAVDTTAAGDTFTGYFIAGVATGESVAKTMEIAAKAAAITVSRQGASSAIPKYEEIAALFNE